MSALLGTFLASFRRGLASEMAALRERLGPFEVPLTPSAAREVLEDGAGGEDGEETGSRQGRSFRLASPNDRLVAGMECTLRFQDGECGVTLRRVLPQSLLLQPARALPETLKEVVLVVYPWFLYERLTQALGELEAGTDFFPENALALFGKGAVIRIPSSDPLPEASSLNRNQREAVRLCRESSHAFIWGPPGTGKTTTLAGIITALAADGHRILVVSTTHAAVDQALARLVESGELAPAFARGEVLRLGETEAPLFGTDLRSVRDRLEARIHLRLNRTRSRAEEVLRRLREARPLAEKIRAASAPRQSSLFGGGGGISLDLQELTALFPGVRARLLAYRSPVEQKRAVLARLMRLEALLPLLKATMERLWQRLREEEVRIVHSARVLFATLTHVTLSPLLAAERFDVVIIEEAGMAILPTLFYCASLARRKVIAVGDPRQIPPITQSREAIVHRTMGRNIFEVAGVDRPDHPHTVLLEVQYRMAPAIGELVSSLYYEGRLRHAPSTAERAPIAAMPPRPGEVVVVIDTQGRFPAEIQPGGFSRFNLKSAQLSVELAEEAYLAGLDSIAIITPYAEQARRIRTALSEAKIPLLSVESATVHRFQGQERDLVILDTVDTAPHRPGVLLAGIRPGAQAANLLNVSISRARGKLIIIADVAYFKSSAPRSPVTELLLRALGEGHPRSG